MSVLGKLFCFDASNNMEFLDKFVENDSFLIIKMRKFINLNGLLLIIKFVYVIDVFYFCFYKGIVGYRIAGAQLQSH